MNCAPKPIAFAGYGSFNSLLEKIQGVSAIKIGNTFTDLTFVDLATWRTLIAGVAGMLAFPISTKRGYDNTTDDLAIEKSNLGFGEVVDNPLPSMIGYIDGSICDYKTVQVMNGQSFDFVLHLKGGAQAGTRNDQLVTAGLRGTVYTRQNLPLAEDRQKSYPVYIMFDEISEFENMVVVNPTYTFRQLTDYRPIGLSMFYKTIYTESVAVVQINLRTDGSFLEGLTAPDWEVISTNGPDVAVLSIVDDLTGQYSLTVQRLSSTVPAALEAGEWAWIQVTDDDESYITHSSNLILIKE
ncbi:MAG: hypothetical protein JRC68_10035, partial [Deltaproteobacteria bacterium]|nr:hypothetical protein [Deltaproteobacteria bacterium]